MVGEEEVAAVVVAVAVAAAAEAACRNKRTNGQTKTSNEQRETKPTAG